MASRQEPSRTWRKLHLAIKEHHQVLACELTMPEVGGTRSQIATPFESFMGDGAFLNLAHCLGLAKPAETLIRIRFCDQLPAITFADSASSRPISTFDCAEIDTDEFSKFRFKSTACLRLSNE